MIAKVFAVLAILTNSYAFAQGGPPMITDDPGTPGDGRFEINLPQMVEQNKDGTSVSFPYWDINYGVGERLQLKYEAGINEFKPNHDGVKVHGPSDGLVGVKYRFKDGSETDWALSTYPALSYRQYDSSKNPDLAPPGNQFYLPISGVLEMGHFAINPELGYRFAKKTETDFEYGTVLGYTLENDAELLAELRGASRPYGDGTELIYNFGFRYPLNKHVRLIGAVGHTFTTFKSDLPTLISYFGFSISP